MTEKTDPKVFVTVVRQPTKETLLNIAHGLKQQNKRLREKLAARLEAERRAEPFNAPPLHLRLVRLVPLGRRHARRSARRIRGLATIKVKP